MTERLKNARENYNKAIEAVYTFKKKAEAEAEKIYYKGYDYYTGHHIIDLEKTFSPEIIAEYNRLEKERDKAREEEKEAEIEDKKIKAEEKVKKDLENGITPEIRKAITNYKRTESEIRKAEKKIEELKKEIEYLNNKKEYYKEKAKGRI